MGGPAATVDLQKGHETHAWLGVSNDKQAKVSGCYFNQKREANHHSETNHIELQEEFVTICEQITGVRFPIERE